MGQSPCAAIAKKEDGTSSIYNYWAIQEEHTDEKTEALNEKGRGNLTEL